MSSEGAGAIGLAAMLHGNIPHADKTAAVISGGNIDVNMISRIIENGLVKSGRRIKLLTHLTDRPGELRRFVSYIEEYKANIVYVYHEHAGRNLPIGQTQVEMDLETRDHAHAEFWWRLCVVWLSSRITVKIIVVILEAEVYPCQS